jgi:PHD/YefM family antitoxin component YafN of YafNO toxin-antitoxin module
MSVKVSLQEAQKDLPELLDQLARTEEEFVVQINGKDCAVIVSAKQWRRRGVARRLDAQSSELRLSKDQQARTERLLSAKKSRSLTPAERRELKRLLEECDKVMLRRAAAMETIL